MKWSERRSIWRNSFRLSGSTVISGHHAPSPSSKSNLEETGTEKKGEEGKDEIAAGWVFVSELQQGREKCEGEEKLGEDGKEKVRGKYE